MGFSSIVARDDCVPIGVSLMRNFIRYTVNDNDMEDGYVRVDSQLVAHLARLAQR